MPFRATRVLGMVLLGAIALAGRAADVLATPAGIAVVPAPAFNLAVKDIISDHYAVATLTSAAHNWWACQFTGLPTDAPTTIGLSMAGLGTSGLPANVAKWRGLAAVMSYADPARMAAYERFTRGTDGVWRSTDPLTSAKAREAGTGTCPEQAAIPADLAEAFLSKDGASWEPWREVDHVETLPAYNVFRVRQHFRQPSATVAMRVPFLEAYQTALVARLRAAARPGVQVDDLGASSGKRPLVVIRLEPTDDAPVTRTILVTAREHATEHASSWAVIGMLEALLRDDETARRLRAGTAWLLIPLQDPDGAAACEPEHLTDRFRKPHDPATPREVFAYTRYLTDYVNRGRTLDLAVALHNVEATECGHLYAPYASSRHATETTALTTLAYAAMTRAGYRTGGPSAPWMTGVLNQRLFGWCGARLGACEAAFEVNDRYPTDRMSLSRLTQMGGVLAEALHGWCRSETGARWHETAEATLTTRGAARAAYFADRGYGPDQRTNFDVLTLGY